METLHCNFCSHIPQFQDRRRYFIASCGHVYCQNCVSRAKDNCAVCKLACRVVEVNAQSKPEVKMYFQDPLAVLRDSLKQTTQVLTFQKTQQKSFQSIICRFVESYKKLSAEAEGFKKNMENLKNENQALLQKIEAMEQEHQNWIGSGTVASGDASQPFSMQQQPITPSTPRTSFSTLFGERGANTGDVFQSRDLVTPGKRGENTPFVVGRNNDVFNRTPQSAGNHSNPSSSGAPIHYGPGRLTMPRTPTSDDTPGLNRFASPFSPAPGAGRPQQSQTPDLVNRLRHLRCTTATPTNKKTPAPRSYMN